MSNTMTINIMGLICVGYTLLLHLFLCRGTVMLMRMLVYFSFGGIFSVSFFSYNNFLLETLLFTLSVGSVVGVIFLVCVEHSYDDKFMQFFSDAPYCDFWGEGYQVFKYMFLQMAYIFLQFIVLMGKDIGFEKINYIVLTIFYFLLYRGVPFKEDKKFKERTELVYYVGVIITCVLWFVIGWHWAIIVGMAVITIGISISEGEGLSFAVSSLYGLIILVVSNGLLIGEFIKSHLIVCSCAFLAICVSLLTFFIRKRKRKEEERKRREEEKRKSIEKKEEEKRRHKEIILNFHNIYEEIKTALQTMNGSSLGKYLKKKLDGCPDEKSKFVSKEDLRKLDEILKEKALVLNIFLNIQFIRQTAVESLGRVSSEPVEKIFGNFLISIENVENDLEFIEKTKEYTKYLQIERDVEKMKVLIIKAVDYYKEIMTDILPDYYQVLGVSVSATNEEIKSAYRKLAKEFHPDKRQGDEQCSSNFHKICTAYTVLSDPEKRKVYDNSQTFAEKYKI